MPVSKAEPARRDRGIMKPRKLLQSQGAFFLQLSAVFNAILSWNAFGALVYIYIHPHGLHLSQSHYHASVLYI